MKKRKLLIILASVMLFACTLVGCKKVEKIDVLKKDLPQLVYVVGSDLNLSTGKLTALIGDETVEVPLNDPEVSISGYDKNKVGDQVVTVTYGEKTTTFKVTVVPRVVVKKFETAYFVGEEFDETKGELIITKDDGTDFIVDMDDETVTVSGFSSETSNSALPVTATYENDGVSYSGSFNVTVYDIADVDFKSPNKKEYDNHESELNVSGGYMSFKNADETLVRHVVLTTDMVSGFDLTAATLEHRETPLVQTLTVEYLGQEKTYDIQINFSDLSLIRLRAEEFKDFEWTEGATPEGCTAEMGDNALEAVSVYFNMTDAEKTDVTEEEVNVLVKTAATYGLDKWKAAFESYKDAFYLKDGGLYWDCTDFEKTKAVYTSLKEKNPVIYEDSLILKQIEENFATTVIVPADEDDEESVDLTIGDILTAVYDTEMMDNFAGQLELMITLYESLADVPAEWTLDDLKTTYVEDVEAAWVLLRESDYTHIQYRSLYSLASKWREKNDFFDILYAYYYDETNVDDAGKVDLDKVNAFNNFRLPGDLETLYSYLYTSKTQVEYMLNGYYKSEELMYYYEQALKLKAKILADGSDMEKDLYARLKFDYLIGNGQGGYHQCTFDELFSALRTTNMGYMYHFNAYVDIPEFEGIWAQLLSIMETATEIGEEYYETEEFGAAVETMFEDYLTMSPTQQVMFMSLLNPYYTQGFPASVWDDSENSANSFVYFVYKHYRNKLPETTHDALKQLMTATEKLSFLGMNPYGIANFTDAMQNVADYLDAVAEESDKTAFENEFAWFYDAYKTLATEKYADPENPVAEDLGEWEDEFDELYTALTQAFFAMELNNIYQANGYRMTLPFLASYEKAEMIANKILASGDENVIKAYYFDFMQKGMKMPTVTQQGQLVIAPNTLGGTADFLMYYIRNAYVTALKSVPGMGFIYDYYQEINVNEEGIDFKEFLAESNYIYYTFFDWTWNLSEREGEKLKYFTDVDQMVKIMSDYRTLTVDQQYFVAALDSFGIYRNALVRFAMEQEMGSDAQATVQQLMLVEQYFMLYQKLPDASNEDGDKYVDLLDEELQIMLEDYYEMSQDAAALSKFTTYFGEMYAYYIAKCEEAGLNTTYTPPVEETPDGGETPEQN